MRGISFSAPLVPLVLTRTKSQTRRIVRCRAATVHGRHPLLNQSYVDPGPSPAGNAGPYLKMAYTGGDYGTEVIFSRCYPTYAVGETLYVKEALRCFGPFEDGKAMYHDGALVGMGWPWKVRVLPGRFMPKTAARAWVRVTGVGIERVQSISDDDARAEGVTEKAPDGYLYPSPRAAQRMTHRAAFGRLWDQVNGRGAWVRNDWVFAYSFERVAKPASKEHAA